MSMKKRPSDALIAADVRETAISHLQEERLGRGQAPRREVVAACCSDLQGQCGGKVHVEDVVTCTGRLSRNQKAHDVTVRGEGRA